MENVINQGNLENIKETIENKLTGISANHLLCAGAGAFILSSGFKMLGNEQTGSFIKKLFIPLIAVGLYKKYKEHSQSGSESQSANNQPEPNIQNA